MPLKEDCCCFCTEDGIGRCLGWPFCEVDCESSDCVDDCCDDMKEWRRGNRTKQNYFLFYFKKINVKI